MNNKTNEEVMLLEGNVIDKTIPYFKGIKSAFEGEDKIEVLSTGKNLFNISKWSSHHNDGHGYFSISGDAITVVSERNDCYSDTGVTTSGVLPEKYRNMTFSCKPNTTYTCSFTMNLNNPSSSYITFFDDTGVTTSGVLPEKYRNMTFSCKPNTTYTCSFTMNLNNPSSSYITFFDKYYNTLSFHGFKTSGNSIVSPNEAKYFTLRVGVHSANGETVVFSDVQVVEGSKKEEYQSHKSNSTKIPLLYPLRSLPNGVCDELIIDRLNHKAKLIQRVGCVVLDAHKSNSTKIPLLYPLRSLPNGVCDELIIDRLNHKAKLIQRVGCVVLDGSIKVNVYPSQEKKDTLLIQTKFPMTEEGKRASCISDTHPHSPYLWTSHITEGIQLGGGGDKYKHIDMRLSKTKVSSNDATRVESYLSKNPTTVLYELKTPIITEIDLEGYPYAYKDGHIFFNSDIAPTTQITYSINQAQQIESANENLQRHEKEISHLQKLIAKYIQVEYESTLLSLKI